MWREKDAQKAYAVLAAATTADPLDYSAWRDRIEAALAWKKRLPAVWPAMWEEITRSFAKFPVAMQRPARPLRHEPTLRGLHGRREDHPRCRRRPGC